MVLTKSKSFPPFPLFPCPAIHPLPRPEKGRSSKGSWKEGESKKRQSDNEPYFIADQQKYRGGMNWWKSRMVECDEKVNFVCFVYLLLCKSREEDIRNPVSAFLHLLPLLFCSWTFSFSLAIFIFSNPYNLLAFPRQQSPKVFLSSELMVSFSRA